ncbi:cytochrome b/b6 domain-containing protein [Pseudomonas reactans]|uniref:cytochrome b/b6 domain-containing protein n=1 Tax=Pseudomonas reactans TaxID=117680 RepID=UPI0031B5CC32
MLCASKFFYKWDLSVTTPRVYSGSQVWLHWMSTVVILWALLSGFYMAVFDVAKNIKNGLAFFNISLTTLYIPFYIFRLYSSFFHGFSSGGKRRSLSDYMALLVHKSIYMVLGVVLVTGVLMMDRPINVFNFLRIAQPLADPVAIHGFTQVHIQACMVLLALVVLHVGAVIVHESCGRPVLKNMGLSRSGDGK